MGAEFGVPNSHDYWYWPNSTTQQTQLQNINPETGYYFSNHKSNYSVVLQYFANNYLETDRDKYQNQTGIYWNEIKLILFPTR
jgi:hypothetical protein